MKNRDCASGVSLVPHVLVSASGLLLGILLFSCNPPPPLDLQHLPDFCVSFFPVAGIGPETAFGDITIRNNNEIHNGRVDIKQDRNGFFNADFYGPLGISIASMHADSLHGTISFEDRAYTFLLNRAMDTLPFEWGRELTFKDFSRVLLGQMPVMAASTFCKKQPDSVVRKRNTIYALWKTDSLEMRMAINCKSGQPKEASLHFNKHAPFWQMQMGSFHRGIAHKIQFLEHDGNYFLINYTKVNFNE